MDNTKLAVVTIVIGNQAKLMFEVAESFFQAYANKINADFIFITERKFPNLAANLEKFQIYDLFNIYERILYLDTDILVSPRTPDLFKIVPLTHIGAVFDNRNNNEVDTTRQKEIQTSQLNLGNINWKSRYVNSGVLVLSREHRDIFTKPHLRKKMTSEFNDQTLINYNIQKHHFSIYKLHEKFNGMQLNNFTSRNINPKNPRSKGNNKTEAFILHFAGEHNKIKEMKKVAKQLSCQIGNNIKPTELKLSVKHIPWQERRLMRRRIKNLKLFYDISELGWSMYLAAHIKYLHQQGEKVGIITTPGKFVMYRDCVDLMLPLPIEYKQTFGKFPSDGNHLFDPISNMRIKDHKLLAAPFKKAYPQHKDNIVTIYSKFENKRIFEPYKHRKSTEKSCDELLGNFKTAILVFPRCRSSKFKARNISQNEWVIIIDTLCINYPNHKIVSIGTTDGAYNLKVNHRNFIDLVGYNDDMTLDILVAFCNTKKATAAIGNQSGTVKMTLLCKTPTFIFGDETQRHQVDENWSKTKCSFYECKLTGNGYLIKDLNKLTKQMITFINSCL